MGESVFIKNRAPNRETARTGKWPHGGDGTAYKPTRKYLRKRYRHPRVETRGCLFLKPDEQQNGAWEWCVGRNRGCVRKLLIISQIRLDFEKEEAYTYY